MINQSINDHINVSKSLIIHESNIENIAKECLNVLKKTIKFYYVVMVEVQLIVFILQQLVGRFTRKKSLPAYSLASNQSNLTSISNDYGFENVFSRQIDGLGNEGDILIALSHLGIVKILLMQQNVNNKMITVGFTGSNGGIMNNSICNYLLKVDSNNTARIQNAFVGRPYYLSIY